MAAGVVGGVASTVLACRATLRLSETLDDIQKNLSMVNHENAGLTADERDKARIGVYIHGGLQITKLYAPAVLVGGASVACLVGAHVQMTRRNAALMAAYTAVQEAYDTYRERVREQIGEEREREIFHGIETEVIKEDGKNKEVKSISNAGASPYAKVFDRGNKNWQRDPELNRMFIASQQLYANHRLHANGHVFLNDVYRDLGFEDTAAGAVVGWVLNGDGDNHIDFGMYSVDNVDFFGDSSDAIFLDFNVDGVVYDKI